MVLNMANFLKKFLDKLAKANDEAFEGQIPDCCGSAKPGEPNQAKQPVKKSK
jgi:hypothetical protein